MNSDTDMLLVGAWNEFYPLSPVKSVRQIPKLGKELEKKTEDEKLDLLKKWQAAIERRNNTAASYDRYSYRSERKQIERQHRLAKDHVREEGGR